MKHTSIPPFYVGQEVVALESWGTKPYSIQKDLTYKVSDVQKACCGWVISVGVPAKPNAPNYQTCRQCGSKTHIGQELFWAAYLFAPITSTFQSITLEKVLEEETKLIGVN